MKQLDPLVLGAYLDELDIPAQTITDAQIFSAAAIKIAAAHLHQDERS